MATARTLRRTGLAVGAGFIILTPAAVAATGTFSGTTSQGSVCGRQFKSPCTVRVKVANGTVRARHTGDSYVEWAAACKWGKHRVLGGETTFWGSLHRGNLRLKNQSYNQHVRGTGGPYTAHEKISLSLHVASKVTGQLSVSAVVWKGPRRINHCHTGIVHFTARR